MDISITTTNTAISRDARRVIMARVEAALDRFYDDIVSVNATISDENGPKGGRDIRCVLTMRGRRFRHLVSVARGDNAEHAATLASRKLADRVRKMRCQLSNHRSRTPQAIAEPEFEPTEWYA